MQTGPCSMPNSSVPALAYWPGAVPGLRAPGRRWKSLVASQFGRILSALLLK
jgi:hypothetical protein